MKLLRLIFLTAVTVALFAPLPTKADPPSGSAAGGSISKDPTLTGTVAAPVAAPGAAPVAPAVISPVIQAPVKDGNCHLVLITVHDPKSTAGDCSQDIDFYTYLNEFINQLVPYVMIIALIMITYSGFQYMMGGAAGDVASAKARITGILGGIIFFFLIRLILNQVAPGLDLKSANPAPVTDPVPAVPAVPVAPVAPPDTKSVIRFGSGVNNLAYFNKDIVELGVIPPSEHLSRNYTTTSIAPKTTDNG